VIKLLITKTANITSNSVTDAITEFNVNAMTDIANTLRIDNLPVMQIDPDINDINFTTFILSAASTSSSVNKSGAHTTYFEFINNFAQYDCGMVVSNRILTHAYLAIGSDRTYVPRAWINFSDVGAQIPHYHPFDYDASPAIVNIGACPYYMYNGTDVAYFAIGHINHCILFAKLKSIDDDTVTKYVVFTCCNTSTNTANTDPFYYGTYRNVYIMDSPNMIYNRYENNMHLNVYDGSKIYIEKFIYNGFYSDEIFIFDGVCPNGIFTLNNISYLNIGSNLYLKIT
jgi:hypothetical protein